LHLVFILFQDVKGFKKLIIEGSLHNAARKVFFCPKLKLMKKYISIIIINWNDKKKLEKP